MRERHKRNIALKIDPETKEKYWSNEVVTVYKPDEEDRVNAVLDILKGVMTAEEVRKKFDIATVNSVYTWIGKYVTQERALSLEEQSDEDMARKSKDDQIRELQAQLKQARKEAELEKLRAKAYDTMINLAEERILFQKVCAYGYFFRKYLLLTWLLQREVLRLSTVK